MSISPQKQKLLKIAGLVATLLIAMLLIFVTCVVIKYKNGTRRNAQPIVVVQPHYNIPEGHGLTVGDTFAAELVVRLPWHDSVKVATADPGTGLLLLRDPDHSRSFGWGTSDWLVSVPLQCFRSGEVGNGVLHIDFFRGGDLEIKLPPVTAADLNITPGTDLQLAGHINVREPLNWPLILAIVCGILLIVLIALRFFLHKKREKAEAALFVPPWERAMLAIEELRSALQNGMFSVERAVGELTDIERRYLEQRFNLKAERQTTGEFLADMERNYDLLSDEQRRNLCDFLMAADMVKFAKLPAEPVMFDRASQHARELIRSTTPDDTSKNKGASA